MTIDEFFALIDYPIHEATMQLALFGERGVVDGRGKKGWWLWHPIERKDAIKLSRRCMFLAKLRGATNGKYGRQFGIEYPS